MTLIAIIDILILNEFRGVILFNHQSESVQAYYISRGEQEGRLPESYFNNGKPSDLQDCDFTLFELYELARADILTYIEYLNEKIGDRGDLLQPVTKKGYYEAVKSFLEWVEDEFEGSFENPCISAKRALKRFERAGAKPRPKVAKYIPFDKLARVLNVVERDYPLDAYVIFLLMIHSPPRKSELLTTKRANVVMTPELNYFESGFEVNAMKEGGVLFFFPPDVARVLKSYFKWLDCNYPNSEYLFPAMKAGKRGHKYRSSGWLDNIIDEIEEKIGFHFSAHWFRHTMITNRLHGLGRCKERCPASINEKLMNHASSGTESRYYDQLSVFNRTAEMPVGALPIV